MKTTPLFDEHQALDAKMVPFAGFSMPIQYPTGIRAEHEAVRTSAGLFDVSHMGEFEIRGPQALELVQRVTVNDAGGLDPGQAQYSALCREDGGVVDDLLVYRIPHGFMLVVNAANREKDLEWILHLRGDLEAEVEDRSDEVALLALQGPRAQEILTRHTEVDLEGIGFYRSVEGEVEGVPGRVSRTGYTGEDGFELYVPADGAARIWRALVAHEEHGVVPAGLGARDTLRLEAGLALYGQDLDEEHTPVEAGLGWIVKEEKGEFMGREVLARQKREGVQSRLMGIRLEERGFPRPGYPVVADGETLGTVTSGTLSPSLGHGIALAYLPARWAEPGAAAAIRIRRKDVPGRIQRPPFYTQGSLRR